MCGGGQERNTSAKVFSHLINNLIFQDENNLKLNANAATLYAYSRFSSKIYRNEVWFKDSAQYCIISGCHIDMLEK